MARGRMVNKKISSSKRVNDLPIPAALLYTWIIPHLDCNGVFYGDARLIKSLVFPRQIFNERQIEKWLVLMENSKNDDGIPLIYRYFINKEQLLWMPGFEGEQTGLRKDKEHPEFKTPPTTDTLYVHFTEIIRNYYGKFPHNRIEENMNRKESEENTATNTYFGEIFTAYESNIGMITPAIADEIKDAVGEYPTEWVLTAIKKATVLEKRSWGYVVGILKGWKRDGFNPDGAKPQEAQKARTGW